MKRAIYLFGILSAFAFAGCDEDEFRDTDDGTEIVGPEGILNNLKATNLTDEGFPWYGLHAFGIDDLVRLKSWNVAQDGFIPVKTGGFDLAEQALDKIELEIGKTLFDRISIANVPNEHINRGIIVSQETALGAFGSTTDPNGCGHVSEGIGTTSYPPHNFYITETAEGGQVLDYVLTDGFYDATGTIDAVLYVHIGAPACENEIDLDLVIHEFGHALGMGPHFDGFGNGPAIDGNFWNVLYNLYNNPTGTTEDQLTILQVKF